MTHAESESSVRQQYVFPAALVRHVESMAERQGVSKSELVRRAVEAYDPELEGVSEADLAALLQQLRLAVREAGDRVEAMIARIERWPEERARERAEVRVEAERWAESHPEAIEAVSALLREDL